jgi:XrtJ-associated TM-motif-TM protein
MNCRWSSLLALVLFVAAFPLLAQQGCVDSPEDPTVVLALVGAAGALAMALRTFRRRKN